MSPAEVLGMDHTLFLTALSWIVADRELTSGVNPDSTARHGEPEDLEAVKKRDMMAFGGRGKYTPPPAPQPAQHLDEDVGDTGYLEDPID